MTDCDNTVNEGLETLFREWKEMDLVKEYTDEPKCGVRLGDYIFTYCVEKTIVSLQPTLAVSRLDGGPIGNLPQEIINTIDKVFGSWVLAHQCVFPKRGHTRKYIWMEK